MVRKIKIPAIYLSENRYLRLVTLCSMYVAQGIPFGFVTITLVAYLSGLNMGVGAIASITAMSALPWAFKWAWGPLIDRFRFVSMGNRRPWIIVAQALMALTLLAMIAIPDIAEMTLTLLAAIAVPDMPENLLVYGKTAIALSLLSGLVFIHNCFASLQDVSVDALAVDLLEEKERGKANGFMYASSYLGTFIGGACMGRLMAAYNLQTAVFFQFCVLLAIMMLPLMFRERPGEKLFPWTKGSGKKTDAKEPKLSTAILIRNICKAFSLRSSILAAVFGICTYLANCVLYIAGSIYFIQELGWTEKEFSDAAGGYVVFAGLAGSLCGGFLADRLGAKNMIAAASILLGLAYIRFSYTKPYWHFLRQEFIVPFFAVEAFLLGLFAVSFFSLAMSVSWPKVAATQFTVYMACMNLSRTAGFKLAEPIYERMNFETIYLVMGVFQILIVALLLPIDPGQTRRALGDGENAVRRNS